jgi:hypothetical protein
MSLSSADARPVLLVDLGEGRARALAALRAVTGRDS